MAQHRVRSTNGSAAANGARTNGRGSPPDLAPTPLLPDGRTTELYVTAGVAAAHLEDQVLPKRCGHIAGKAIIEAGEMIGKLRMIRDVADDLGNGDFVIIARTDAVSAVDAPEPQRGLPLA